jgi:hypothetical protein
MKIWTTFFFAISWNARHPVALGKPDRLGHQRQNLHMPRRQPP